jgi:hypothetical protein
MNIVAGCDPVSRCSPVAVEGRLNALQAGPQAGGDESTDDRDVRVCHRTRFLGLG